MKICFFTCLLCIPFFSLGQESNRNLRISTTINQEKVELGKKYYVEALDDSISFETIKFYIGHLQFFQGEDQVEILDKKHFLVDAEKPESFLIPLSVDLTQNLTKITFNLGVDSLISASGVFGGDLDPTNGMYWTWQSGYINVKLEGTADKCPARNHEFQFHIGGYQAPFNTLQEVELPIFTQEDIQLTIALDTFLSKINLLENHRIMSPNAKAVEAAQNLLSSFSISE